MDSGVNINEAQGWNKQLSLHISPHPSWAIGFIVTLKGEMTMFYIKVIFRSGLQPTASHEVHTTPAERQKADCKTLSETEWWKPSAFL